MAISHARPGQVIDLPTAAVSQGETGTIALFKAEQLEVIRMVLPAGQDVPPHSVEGEITAHCLSGRVSITGPERTVELGAGQMLYLSGGQEHSLRALADSILLVTICLVPGPQHSLEGARGSGNAHAQDAPGRRV